MSADPSANPLAQVMNGVLSLVFWPASLIGLPVPKISEIGADQVAEELQAEAARGGAASASGGRSAGGAGGGARGGTGTGGASRGGLGVGRGLGVLPGLPGVRELVEQFSGDGNGGDGGATTTASELYTAQAVRTTSTTFV